MSCIDLGCVNCRDCGGDYYRCVDLGIFGLVNAFALQYDPENRIS